MKTFHLYLKTEVSDKIHKLATSEKVKKGGFTKAVIDYVKSLSSTSRFVDIEPALNGEIKNHTNWNEFYSKQEGEAEGKRMIIAPDILDLEGRAFDSARIDFDKRMIVNSGFHYIDGCNDRIEHNIGNTISHARPKFSRILGIPVYQGTCLSEIMSKSDGRYLLANLFNEWNMNCLAKKLVHISGKEPSNICLWTLPYDQRTKDRHMAIGFDYGGGRFHISSYDFWFGGNLGRSRGVLLNTRRK